MTAMSPLCPATFRREHTSEIADRYPSGTRVNLTLPRALAMREATSESSSAHLAMKVPGSDSNSILRLTISSRTPSSSEFDRNTHRSNLSRTWSGRTPSSESIVATRRNAHSVIPDTPSLSTTLIPVSAALVIWNTRLSGSRLMFSARRMLPSARFSSPSEVTFLPLVRVSSTSIPPNTPSSVDPSGRLTTLLPPAMVEIDLARTDFPVPVGPQMSTDDMSGDARAQTSAPLALSFPTNAENGYSGLTPRTWSSAICRAPLCRGSNPGTGSCACGAA